MTGSPWRSAALRARGVTLIAATTFGPGVTTGPLGVVGVAAPRSTCSQSGATTSCASATTLSVPAPQVMLSTSPSRASIVSLP